MSKVIDNLKGVVLISLTAKKEVKEAILNIFDELNTCLDGIDFDSEMASEELESALEELDNALIDKEPEILEPEPNAVLTHKSLLPDENEDADQPKAFGES